MASKEPIMLITSCSSGIGNWLSLAFATKGITVLATARLVESLQELTSQHENIEAPPLELGGPKTIEMLRDIVVKRTGGHLDFLVNNAGTHYAATAMDLNVEEVVKLFTVNVFAVMRLCQHGNSIFRHFTKIPSTSRNSFTVISFNYPVHLSGYYAIKGSS